MRKTKAPVLLGGTLLLRGWELLHTAPLDLLRLVVGKRRSHIKLQLLPTLHVGNPHTSVKRFAMLDVRTRIEPHNGSETAHRGRILEPDVGVVAIDELPELNLIDCRSVRRAVLSKFLHRPLDRGRELLGLHFPLRTHHDLVLWVGSLRTRHEALTTILLSFGRVFDAGEVEVLLLHPISRDGLASPIAARHEVAKRLARPKLRGLRAPAVGARPRDRHEALLHLGLGLRRARVLLLRLLDEARAELQSLLVRGLCLERPELHDELGGLLELAGHERPAVGIRRPGGVCRNRHDERSEQHEDEPHSRLLFELSTARNN